MYPMPLLQRSFPNFVNTINHFSNYEKPKGFLSLRLEFLSMPVELTNSPPQRFFFLSFFHIQFDFFFSIYSQCSHHYSARARETRVFSSFLSLKKYYCAKFAYFINHLHYAWNSRICKIRALSIFWINQYLYTRNSPILPFLLNLSILREILIFYFSYLYSYILFPFRPLFIVLL